jgi:hypothetical protein
MIRQRTKAGLRTIKARIDRDGQFTARRSGIVRKRLGRPSVSDDVVKRVQAELVKGTGILKTAERVGCGSGTVQRIRREMQA